MSKLPTPTAKERNTAHLILERRLNEEHRLKMEAAKLNAEARRALEAKPSAAEMGALCVLGENAPAYIVRGLLKWARGVMSSAIDDDGSDDLSHLSGHELEELHIEVIRAAWIVETYGNKIEAAAVAYWTESKDPSFFNVDIEGNFTGEDAL